MYPLQNTSLFSIIDILKHTMFDAFLHPFRLTFQYLEPILVGLRIVWEFAPIWAPILLGYALWRTWVGYIRSQFIANEDYTLLEINIPEEQQKSPLAMEIALTAFHQTGGEGTFIKRWWEGSVRPWFSLELVSIEGEVHFFVWTREFFKDIVTSGLYAQFPDIEIHEVQDYTHFLEFDTEEIDIWGCEFDLTQSDVYPIKTYVDYGLDKPAREEEKVDPIASTLEYLGSLRTGEQAWIQILIRAHKGDWKQRAKREIDRVLQRDPETKTPEVRETSGAPFPVTRELSKEEQEVANAIQRSLSKKVFDCGIRGLYIAEKETFRPVNIPGLIGSFRQYDSETLNGFKPTGGMTKFNYPWQDYKDIRKNKVKQQLFDAYRRRSYFHSPYKKRSFVLNNEELATLFHFPGGVAQTPTFHRIESKKSEPPTDLPG